MSDFQHGGAGTTYSYRSCRCDECTQANTRRLKRRRHERYQLAEKTARHGTKATYTNWGCRCSECTAANTTYYRLRRQKLKKEVAV